MTPEIYEKLSDLIRSDMAPDYLHEYFGVGLAEGELPKFTGGRFELFAGGGNRSDTQDEFTPADVLSVQFLSVRVPGPVALNLLEGTLAKEATERLREIPVDSRLWDANAESLIAKDNSAYALWHLLKGPKGMGPVTAGKLLARKRPALIPIYDSIVGCALKTQPGSFWTEIRGALRHDNGRLLNEIKDLKKTSQVPNSITKLRVLDVVVWMHHQKTGSHIKSGCPGPFM